MTGQASGRIGLETVR